MSYYQRHNTKKGPGRLHLSGVLVAGQRGNMLRPASRPVGGRKRLKPEIHGGNWQGKTYVTYAEHDRAYRRARDSRGSRDIALMLIVGERIDSRGH